MTRSYFSFYYYMVGLQIKEENEMRIDMMVKFLCGAGEGDTVTTRFFLLSGDSN